MEFISVEHPLENRQVESTNKDVLSSIKKKLNEAKGLWLSSSTKCYDHIIQPNIPQPKILHSRWLWVRWHAANRIQHSFMVTRELQWIGKLSRVGKCCKHGWRSMGNSSHLGICSKANRGKEIQHKSTTISDGDRKLGVSASCGSYKKGKLHPKWEGPYVVLQKLSHGAYKLESLEEKEIRRT